MPTNRKRKSRKSKNRIPSYLTEKYFKEMEFRKLKLKAMKKPQKIRKYSFLMLGCFVFTYLLIMLMEIMETLGRLL